MDAPPGPRNGPGAASRDRTPTPLARRRGKNGAPTSGCGEWPPSAKPTTLKPSRHSRPRLRGRRSRFTAPRRSRFPGPRLHPHAPSEEADQSNRFLRLAPGKSYLEIAEGANTLPQGVFSAYREAARAFLEAGNLPLAQQCLTKALAVGEALGLLERA